MRASLSSSLAFAVLAIFVATAAGCVDARACMQARDWKPCDGEKAQPGGSGTPPTITKLTAPTCAYLDSPTVVAHMLVTDPDGDAQVVKGSFYGSAGGPRANEQEFQILDSYRTGTTTWDFGFTLATQMPMFESTDVVRIKVTDRQGGQSAPYCGEQSLIR